MATFGHIEPFSGVREDFELYIERLEQYLVANDLDAIALSEDESNQSDVNSRDAKRRAILLSVIGPQTYSLLHNIMSPEKPATKTYSELVKKLRDHIVPKPTETVQRFKFHSRYRRTGETIADFVSELRKLAESCNFGTYLNDMLRDCLVCGVSDERIQRRLLLESTLTLDKAYSIAVAQEVASRDASVFRQAATPTGANAITSDVDVDKISSSRKYSGTAQKFRANSGKQYTAQKSPFSGSCYRCASTDHLADKCKHKNTECNYCHKTGHLERACLSRKRAQNDQKYVPKQRSNTNTVFVDTTELSSVSDVLYHIFSVTGAAPLRTQVTVNGVPVLFQIDTGAGVSLINVNDYNDKFHNCELSESSVKLRAYTGNAISVVGQCNVTAELDGQSVHLLLVVVEGNGPPLLGRSWLQKLRIPWDKMFDVNAVHNDQVLQSVLREFNSMFSNATGLLQDVTLHFEYDKSVSPEFYKHRSPALSMRRRIESELDNLQTVNIIKKVTHAEWAAPVVPVVKKSGSIRLCGDYKLTANKAVILDRYPLPLAEELFSELAGGERFTKLDLSQAYHQVAIDEESQELTTINTHCGLYKYLRLPYSISSAVSLFQRTMDNLLKGLPGVTVFLDDILVTGKTSEEHVQNLRAVLQRLSDSGLKLRREKCQFFLPAVEFLGLRISADGVQPTPSKVRAIKEAPRPQTVSELRSFLGLVNHYAKFLPHLAHHLTPLSDLLRADQDWVWGKSQEAAFCTVRDMISEDLRLSHYYMDRPLVMSCDASAVGIGAVLQQPDDNGVYHPVAYVSRKLTDTERRYPQIEREALAIAFGAQKFRQYLLGCSFTLLTDHKPLVTLLGEKNGIPQLVSARIKRWALLLSAYKYEIKYITSKENVLADYLSRAPLPDLPDAADSAIACEDIMLIDEEGLSQIPLTSKVIAAETVKDPVLSKAFRLTQEGWPETCPEDDLKPYHVRRLELTTDQGCLMWGSRVIIPKQLRAVLLLDLHAEHMGVSRMKSTARQYFWWPKLNDSIEEIGRHCLSCQETAPLPAAPPVASWNWPSGPWKRLHMDFAGEFKGFFFLIVIDSYSKWLEIFRMTRISAASTISQLRRLFATFGIPEHVVTDNGTQFMSEEFQDFLQKNHIKHTPTPVGHPASNGMAERYVQYFKHQMKKMDSDPGSLDDKISRMLLAYRSTPHAATNETPSNLLMRRELRTRYSCLRSSMQTRKSADVFDKNVHCSPRFAAGDPVFALNLRSGPRWVPGVIIDVLNRSYYVQVEQKVWKRHEDQLRKRSPLFEPPSDPEPVPGSLAPDSTPAVMPSFPAPAPLPEPTAPPAPPPEPAPPPSSSSAAPPPVVPLSPKTVPRRYPVRDRQPPKYLKDYSNK